MFLFIVEFLMVFFVCFFVLSQIVIPIIMKGPTFPLFKKEIKKLENEYDDVLEEKYKKEFRNRINKEKI